jgi:hypothetical protein
MMGSPAAHCSAGRVAAGCGAKIPLALHLRVMPALGLVRSVLAGQRQLRGIEMDHYRRVQQEEATLQEAHGWAVEARRRASVALWSSGATILLAVVVLLSG